MIRLRQHVPGFVAGLEPASATVASVAEMLALPWVNEWTTTPGFLRFSYKDRLLMAELAGGFKWWVVAYIDEGDVPATELPDWAPPAIVLSVLDEGTCGTCRAADGALAFATPACEHVAAGTGICRCSLVRDRSVQ